MTNIVSTVNGYEIHVEAKPDGLWMTYTYWVQVGPKWDDTKEWKTLRGAIAWCEKH